MIPKNWCRYRSLSLNDDGRVTAGGGLRHNGRHCGLSIHRSARGGDVSRNSHATVRRGAAGNRREAKQKLRMPNFQLPPDFVQVAWNPASNSSTRLDWSESFRSTRKHASFDQIRGRCDIRTAGILFSHSSSSILNTGKGDGDATRTFRRNTKKWPVNAGGRDKASVG
jgi:hypothetical protein